MSAECLDEPSRGNLTDAMKSDVVLPEGKRETSYERCCCQTEIYEEQTEGGNPGA